jgi:ketopantoate hydroxymethyltransferase
MGHVGLMPQRVHAMGGYKYQGRNDDDANSIFKTMHWPLKGRRGLCHRD